MPNIRTNFSERVVVLPDDEPWISSPTPGVERKMLDRMGDEIARATSIVRFAPHSQFPEHVHHGGEEFFVLEGLFVDQDGEYPVGTYVRNPIGSKHAPRAGRDGATLFVKLHQFAARDTQRVIVQASASSWLQGGAPGITVLPLHEFGEEHVALVRWAPHTRFYPHIHWGGEEILVVDGVFRDEHGSYPAGSWLRAPNLSTHTPYTAAEGATILVKVGHLLAGDSPSSIKLGCGS